MENIESTAATSRDGAVVRRVGAFGCAVLFLCAACRLFSQEALYVKSGDTMLLVQAARGMEPMVEHDGKLARSRGTQFALLKAEDFMPALVEVRNLRVTNSYTEGVNSARRTNETLMLQAEFESASDLERVFLVLDLRTESAGEGLFLQEVGQLGAHRPVPVLVHAAAVQLGRSTYRVHVFSNGVEVLTSTMPVARRERILDRMVRRKIKGLKDAPPTPLLAPRPAYPADLLRSKVDGSATVRLRIARNGAVLAPVVTGASDPAFGTAALAALRDWRFLPEVRDGRPVEAEIELPLQFRCPAR